ncbi:S1 family peptidase [Granulicoccus phenolivorans]|uniref:S1 family peptidase n=1 Tax=Granulicoccus phenolivorans TaxID=266854 RepID=UPI0014702C2A|nr:serine protease [Granulicoccus phenolivorans]
MSQRKTMLLVGIPMLVVVIILGVVTALVIDNNRKRGTGPGGTASPVEQISGTPGPQPPPEVLDRTRSGVRRVVALTCGGTGIGTAFRFGEYLVTTQRVVDQAVAVGIVVDGRTVSADVVRADPATGVALLKPAGAVPGYTFTFGQRQIAIGNQLQFSGFPSGAGTRGTWQAVSGTVTQDAKVTTAGGATLQLRTLAEPLDPGLAGAPVLDETGGLLGMAYANPDHPEVNQVVGLDSMADALLAPAGPSATPATCATPAGPRVDVVVGGSGPDSSRQLAGHFLTAVNAGDTDTAYGLLTPQLQQNIDKATLARTWAGKYALNAALSEGPDLQLTFDRLQSGAPTCQRVVVRISEVQGKLNVWDSANPTACS